MYVRLIRWCFTRFYREFAWTYDAVAALVSGGHWRDWALAALPHMRGQVLELGCGTGYLQQALALHASYVVGLDLSAQMLARTQRRFARFSQHGRLLRGDAQTLPFQSACFDTLVATFPSEYIVAPATLAEVRRVLRSRGQVVIVLAAYFIGDGVYRRLLDLAYRLTLQTSPRDLPVDRLRSLLGERLEAAGFAVDERLVDAPGGRVHMVIGSVRHAATVDEELALQALGHGCIVGVDEVGRGCWAGPVVAAAVWLPETVLAEPALLAGVDDSKALSATQRQAAYARIVALAAGWGVGVIPAHLVDTHGILEATRLAMQVALLRLPALPDALLIDAVQLRGWSCAQRSLIKGDARCLSIAAASIVAKVTRDQMMTMLHARLPVYGFAKHKGYGTRTHALALRTYGLSSQHRATFNPMAAFLARGVWPETENDIHKVR